MKIKCNQLSQSERCTIALALDAYQNGALSDHKGTSAHYADLAQRIRHGEVLLCEYQYTQDEEGTPWS